MLDELIIIPEQSRIIEAPIDEKIIVSASPGTGKTTVLIERIKKLIERDGVSPGSEILVLSFSRAAVKEIRDRLRFAEGDAEFVQVRTFDSFASKTLADFYPEHVSGLDYDQRIILFTNFTSGIRKNGNRNDQLSVYFSSIKHVFIDEMQDLVGCRASMVEELVQSVSCGFTILGDRAQGIYNYQVRNGSCDDVHFQLEKWLSENVEPKPNICLMQTNHRARGGNSRLALDVWPKLAGKGNPYLGADARPVEAYNDLYNIMGRLPTRDVGDIRVGLNNRAAILCRNNGEALWISSYLGMRGIRHHLRWGSQDRSLPEWIGAVLHDQKGNITHSEFKEKIKTRMGNSIDHELAWKTLLRLNREPSRSAQSDVPELNKKISSGYIQDYLEDNAKPLLTVSTIHKSKGLEYEDVYLLDRMSSRESDKAEEARVYFVAMTRAKNNIYKINGDVITDFLERSESERWFASRRGSGIISVQIGPDDMLKTEPALTSVKTKDAADLQKYLYEKVRPGNAVLLRKNKNLFGKNSLPIYEIIHSNDGNDPRYIGRMAEDFSLDLSGILKKGRPPKFQLPDRITGLMVESVETVAGTPAMAVNSGLGDSGLWLSVRIFGLGTLQYLVR